jgi:tRNA uridine 5-carboxymethylaminomethyl modification enzyme
LKNKYYDIVVVGAGHAGIEASVSAARMGCTVALITMDTFAIGRMSCNPAIGGTAKGHLVKEIDALGGVMGELADKAGIQFKMLNLSKGPAVWSPRSQSDNELYSIEARKLILNTDGIDLIQDTISELIVEESNSPDELQKHKIKGVKTGFGSQIICKSVIICSGTFLNAIMHTGKTRTMGGRVEENSATGLSEYLMGFGFEVGRLKTGTPPRLDINTIDFSKTEVQKGDSNPNPFSHKTNTNDFPFLKQVDCYLTHTNELTHEYLKEGFEDSPMFTGRIQGVGPRYCPSIEDKINRFSDKPRHQIFLEPEKLNGNTIYMNGFSSSLSAEIQLKAARTVPGLENVEFIRHGYAVEYDFFPTHQIYPTLETKIIAGLYHAGQINGTSGYEEAAAQGLIAGINSALKIFRKQELVLKRSDSYIGVLIDDLINKVPVEPYRMFTSSAEYRLLLRQDNAALRLSNLGYELGLIEKSYIEKINLSKRLIEDGVKFFSKKTVSPKDINPVLTYAGSNPISQNEFMSNLMRRNEIKINDFLNLSLFNENELLKKIKDDEFVSSQIEIEIKYEGYIKRQAEQIESFNRNENIKIPDSFNYDKIKSLSSEALDKLKKIKPKSIGQASRIAGVNPSDISAILIFMRG